MHARLAITAAAVAVLGLTSIAQGAEVGITNPGFEQDGPGVAAWTIGQGARNGNSGPSSKVEIDGKVARSGKRSLRLSGDGKTVFWQMLGQDFEVAPGKRVLMTVWARCRGLTRQGPQYPNANGMVLFFDKDGKRLGLVTTPVMQGDRDWVELYLDALAPPGTARGQVAVFSSMTGTTWFDDVRVRVADPAPKDPDSAALAFEVFERLLRGAYPFWGMAGRPEADAFFEKWGARAAKPDAFPALLPECIRDLDDVHVSVSIDGRTSYSGGVGGAGTVNFRRPSVQPGDPSLVHQQEHALVQRIGEGDETVGYVWLDALVLADDEVASLEKAISVLSSPAAHVMPRCRGLILDVRANGGGSEPLAQRLIGHFTNKPVLYARQRYRDPTVAGTKGFGPISDRVLQPRWPRLFKGKPVVVLQGPYCVSSTEGLLAMAKALPGVTTVGLHSKGASANPGEFHLWPGMTLRLSRWQSLDLEGNCIEGVGVPPDVEVKGDHTNADPTLQRALEIVRKGT